MVFIPYIFLIAFIINIFTWSYVFAQRKANPVNIGYLITASLFAGWIVLHYLYCVITDDRLIEPIAKILSFTWISAGFAFIHFIYILIEKKRKTIYKVLFTLVIISYIFSISTNYVIDEAIKTYWGYATKKGLLFMPIAFFVVVVPFFYSLFLLFSEIKKSKDIRKRKQITLLIIGTAIPMIVGTITDIVFPSILKISFPRLGAPATVAQSICIFFAITKFRFLSISAEEAAKELFANINDGVLLMNNDGEIEQINAAAKEILEVSDANLSKINAVELIEEYEFTEDFMDYQTVTVNTEFEKHIIISQSTITSSEYSSGKLLIIKDITKLIKAEEEQQLLSLIAKQVFDSILVLNTSSCISYINKAAEELFGYMPEELMGKDPAYLSADTDQEIVQNEISVRMLKGKIWTGTRMIRRKDGNKLLCEVSISPLYDRNGRISAYVAILRDITEKKKAEEILVQAKEVAEKANMAKSMFLANMSHELRTPLNSILGFAKLMRMGYEEEEYNNSLKYIITSGEHLLNLINDILDIAKIEAGKIEFDFELVDIHKVILSCIHSVKPLADEKDIDIGYMTSSEDIIVYADTKWLTQIFLNLLNNAVKFTHKNGIIKVITTEKKGTFTADIIDNGIGISKSDLEFIFGKFSKIRSQPMEQDIEGTGLGLAITKNLIDALSGEISVESEPGKGSKFSVLLPCIRYIDVNEVEIIKEVGILTPICDQYILVVDDIKENRELITTYFNRCNQKYIVAKDKFDCLKKMDEFNDIALILMNIEMQGPDCPEVVKDIKSKFDIPVIVVTAYAMEGDEEKFILSGFDDYISKPIDLSLLYIKIKDLVR